MRIDELWSGNVYNHLGQISLKLKLLLIVQKARLGLPYPVNSMLDI